MSKIISLIGSKGGTGKTTLSHMLGQGFGLLGVRAVVALTDHGRNPLSREGRRYLPADAREPAALKRVATTLRNIAGWVGVIDGGAGRPEFDLELAAASDLVLLPFRESHEDVRVLIHDLERLPGSLALPSQWPTNAWARAAADRTIEQMLVSFKGRVLAPVSSLGASKQLLVSDLSGSLPRPLEDACRGFATEVAALAGLEIESEQARVPRQTSSPPRPEAVTPGLPHAR